MPSGVYVRTEKHIEICRKGGLSPNNTGRYMKGHSKSFLGKRVHTEETKLKMSKTRKGTFTGEDSHNWIEDRTLVKGRQNRNNPEYKQWRKEVWLRDEFTCKIANPDCKGKIEAHHILGWKDYPELRYKVNNGITLCHAHHPRKVAEEKRLIPTFQELVSVSKK